MQKRRSFQDVNVISVHIGDEWKACLRTSFGSAWSFMHTWQSIGTWLRKGYMQEQRTKWMNKRHVSGTLWHCLSGNITRKSCTMYNTFNHQTPLLHQNSGLKSAWYFAGHLHFAFQWWNLKCDLVLAFGRFSLLDFSFRSWNYKARALHAGVRIMWHKNFVLVVTLRRSASASSMFISSWQPIPARQVFMPPNDPKWIVSPGTKRRDRWFEDSLAIFFLVFK